MKVCHLGTSDVGSIAWSQGPSRKVPAPTDDLANKIYTGATTIAEAKAGILGDQNAVTAAALDEVVNEVGPGIY